MEEFLAELYYAFPSNKKSISAPLYHQCDILFASLILQAIRFSIDLFSSTSTLFYFQQGNALNFWTFPLSILLLGYGYI